MRSCLLVALVAAMSAGAAVVDDFNSPEWKGEISRGYLPYRKLAASDFPVSDQDVSIRWMHTEGFIHYSYKANWKQNGGPAIADVAQFTVRSGFDQKKSWKKSQAAVDANLLEHEQGHLDINELHAADFRAIDLPHGSGPNGEAALRDLDIKLKLASDKCLKEAQAEQDRYDAETNHGAQADRQQAWTENLKKRLRDRKITSMSGNAD